MKEPALQRTRIRFLGPTLRSFSKWVISFAALCISGFVLALGLSRGTPHWLQVIGWTLMIFYWVGASVYLIYLRAAGRRRSFGQLGFFPPPVARWVLDRPSEKSNRESPQGLRNPPPA